MFVGNNWEGTADVIDPRGNFAPVARINIIPDNEERMAEIYLDPSPPRLLPRDPRAGRRGQRPVRRRHVLDQRRPPADRLPAELRATSSRSTSPPARSSGASSSTASAPTTWRSRPTASKVAVSASTGNVVHILDIKTGREVGQFESGDSPHENTYSADGKRIYHASIGLVYTPADDTGQPTRARATATSRSSTRAPTRSSSASTWARSSTEAGYPDMSSAVRPMALSPRRAVRLLPGLVLPRLRRVRLQDRTGSAGRRPADLGRGHEHAAGAVPARLRPPRDRR